MSQSPENDCYTLTSNGREITYYFRPAKVTGSPILIILHGFVFGGTSSNWRNPNWNVVCPMDRFGSESKGSWYVGERGDYFHPFNGPMTSGFGWRDSAQHNGVDIDLNKGDKVCAAFDGMVRVAKRYGGFGNVVIVRHYNGLETVYAHLSKLKVKPGQVIIAGQVVGLGGSTGHSTGSHLHFEVRFKGVPINPKYLISFKEQKILCNEITIKKTKWGLAAYPAGEKEHIVEKGDTVFELAKRYATTTVSIRQMNGLTGKVRLKPGQVICIAQ